MVSNIEGGKCNVTDEQQNDMPFLTLRFKRGRARARHGLSIRQVAETVERPFPAWR